MIVLRKYDVFLEAESALVITRYVMLCYAAPLCPPRTELKTSHELPFPSGRRDGNRLAVYGLSDRWMLLGLKVIIYDV